MPDAEAALRPPLVTGDRTIGDVTDDICAPMDRQPTTLWWTAFGVAVAALLLGFAAVWYQVATGVGTWGLNKTVGWAFDITNFVFWVGIGHAGTLISAVLLLFRQTWRTAVNSIGRGDDLNRRGVRGDLSDHSYGSAVVGHLDGSLSKHARAAVGELQVAAVVGCVRHFDVPVDLGGLLVHRPVARLGHDP